MKETTKIQKVALSKLKKEYTLKIDKICGEKDSSTYEIVEDPKVYSKTYIVPYSKIANSLSLKVPLGLTTSNMKKRLWLAYKFKEVDHKKRELLFSLNQAYLENYTNYSSNFQANRNLALKLKNFRFKSKVLLNHKPKRCSKRIQKQIISDLTSFFKTEEECTFEKFLIDMLNRDLQKRIQQYLQRNLDYVKAVVITFVEKILD